MECKRWRRYGKDRLYVSDDSGQQIGWWDLLTDEEHPEHTDDLPRLKRAALEWKQAQESHPEEAVPIAEAAAACADVPETAESPPTVPEIQTELTSDASPNPPAHEAAGIDGTATVDSALSADAPPPATTDLLANSAGHQLAEQIEAAHAAGQRPTLLRRFFLGKNAYSSWERGAIGERLVAKELEKLVRKDPRWGFIHSIPVGNNGADIDHLVIGPGGVFAINTKYHKDAKVWVGGDTIMVNGARQPYVRNSRSEAKRVSRLLTQASGIEVDANGLVVPAGASELTIKAQPDDIRVVNRGRLARFLLQTPDLLDKNTITTLFEYARLTSTWTLAAPTS